MAAILLNDVLYKKWLALFTFYRFQAIKCARRQDNWRFKQIKFSTEDLCSKKPTCFLEHLGRQGWGHTVHDHKQIKHRKKKKQDHQ